MNNHVDEIVQAKQVTELSTEAGSQEANKSQGQFLKGSNSLLLGLKSCGKVLVVTMTEGCH